MLRHAAMNGTIRQLRIATRLSPMAAPRRGLFRTRAQEEHQQQHGKQQQQQQHQSTAVQTREKKDQGAMARREDMPVVPFRRMSEMIDAMQREMDAMTNMMFGGDMGFMMRPFERALGPFAGQVDSALTAMPANFLNIDVHEDDKAYTITADVPGFTKEQIKASLSPDGVLTLTGEQQQQEEQKDDKGELKRRSSRMTQFTRSFRLPQDAKPEEIQAKTEHGVLTVCIPKSEQPKREVKQIPIA